jgi:hypothetical protein
MKKRNDSAFYDLSRIEQMKEACFWFTPPVNSSAFSRNNLTYRLCWFRQIKQEGTGLCPVLPLALRGKAFGFSVLRKHAVISPTISFLYLSLIINHLIV